MGFDLERATTLWGKAIRSETWADDWAIVRITGMSGLGVLSVQAADHARALIYGGRCSFFH